MSEGNKRSNRQLIELLTNHVEHIEKRLARVEWNQWALMLAYLAGWIALVVAVVVA